MHRRTFLGFAAALPFAERLRRLLPATPPRMITTRGWPVFDAGLEEAWDRAASKQELLGNVTSIKDAWYAYHRARLDTDVVPL